MIIQTRPLTRLAITGLVLALLLWGVGRAFGQTTAFTYQGRLTDAGNPASGDFDLQFKLFDTVTPNTGIQLGATLVRTPVTVVAGVFTVTLDFGAGVFGGADRFLEIGVRPAGNAAAYAILAPRQAVTTSPYAIQTLNAQQLGGIPASGFIQNTTTTQAGASFNVGGKGTAGSLDVGGPLTQTGSASPGVAPIGSGRMYFDAATNKVKVSESGGAFVNLVGATGVSGSGIVNSIPLWSGGTTLGSSLITQSGANVFLPNSVVMAAGASSYQVALGSPNGETGLTIASPMGGGRADLRFDGATVKLVAGPAGTPPQAANGVVVSTAGNVLVGATVPTAKFTVGSADINVPAIYGESASRGVWGKSTGSSRGVVGESAAGEGVLGIGASGVGVSGTSTSNIGVLGSSAQSEGVRGVSNNVGHGGVVGVNNASGVGVFGTSAGTGLRGESSASNTVLEAGVLGFSSGTGGVGVRGEALGTGSGVYAKSATGYALAVEGNTVQSRVNGGLVKAMIYVNLDGTIVRCFNSFLAGVPASTGNCGLSVQKLLTGTYRVNFGSRVDDRFVSVSPQLGGGVYIGANYLFEAGVQNSLLIVTFVTNADSITAIADNPFMLIVY